MNSFIKAIIVFNDYGEKRYVKLNEGLNVITGDSKSGKSALLEIIDYCLGSSKSTIPKGEVTKFSSFYSLIFRFPSYSLFIGRKRFEDTGRKQMYLYRTSEDLNPEFLTIELFSEENVLSLDQAKIELSREFGVTITDTTEETDALRKEARPSVRSMTSYMFQHQNLVASKFTLFYRFEDSIKREQVIGQFPIFAGWVDQHYYNLKLELDELLKKKKRTERLQQSYTQATDKIKARLLNTFKRYYMLVGGKLDDNISLQKLLQLRRELPDFTRESYLSEEMEHRYNELKMQREERKQLRYDVETSISNLQLSHGYGESYSSNLSSLQATLNHSINLQEHYSCPLCGHNVDEINDKIVSLRESKQWLKKEIKSVKGHGVEFHAQIQKLMIRKNNINEEIRELNSEIFKIESVTARLKDKKRLDNEVIYARAAIDIECNTIEEQIKSLRNSNDTDSDIDNLNAKINGYNLKVTYAQATTFFNTNMSRIIEKLDFEKEFRPANINFLLETFDLYHLEQGTKSRVYLSEMGSGANWLACHVSLFLCFLHFFAIQKNHPYLQSCFWTSQVKFTSLRKI